jgi:hypothetical protein
MSFSWLGMFHFMLFSRTVRGAFGTPSAISIGGRSSAWRCHWETNGRSVLMELEICSEWWGNILGCVCPERDVYWLTKMLLCTYLDDVRWLDVLSMYVDRVAFICNGIPVCWTAWCNMQSICQMICSNTLLFCCSLHKRNLLTVM